MTALILIAGWAGIWLAGYSLATALCHNSTGRAQRTERLGLALPLGIAAHSGAMYAWSWCGGRLTGGTSWTLALLGIMAGVATLWWTSRRDRVALSEGTVEGAALARLCQWIVGIVLIGTMVLALLTPQRFWDERAIFGIKSKVLFTDGTIDSPILADPDFAQGHPRYPLLIPLAETHVYLLLGRIDDRWSKAVFPLLFAGLVVTFAGVLSRRFGSGTGWLWALLLATLPVLSPYELGFITGQGDAPVACYHGLAVLYAWDWLTAAPACRTVGVRHAILIGVVAAAAAFTKDEGIAYLLVGLIALVLAWCWGWVQIRHQRPTTKNDLRYPWLTLAKFLLIAGGTAAVLLTPWLAHRRALPTTNEMQYFSRLSADRLSEQIAAVQWMVPHLTSRMFREWSVWGLQWWLLIAALITAPIRLSRPAQLFVLLEILGAIAALVVAGMIAPAELHDHIGGSSHRYLLQLSPLAVLFAAGQWGGESGEPTADRGRTGTVE
ncbi:MAG: hypothetical protein U0992_03285 [Planctomycetaceae bacterium]